MIYERRVYYATPGKLQALNDRFANITLKFWEKHGIRPVAFFTHEIGRTNVLEYLLAWESLAEREARWSAFAADAEWIKARTATEVGGVPLTTHIENFILKPTPYSPMQ